MRKAKALVMNITTISDREIREHVAAKMTTDDNTPVCRSTRR